MQINEVTKQVDLSFLLYRFLPRTSLDKKIAQIDAQIQQYLNPTDEAYEKLKNQTAKNVKLKNSLLYKYHPALDTDFNLVMKNNEKEGIS